MWLYWKQRRTRAVFIDINLRGSYVHKIYLWVKGNRNGKDI